MISSKIWTNSWFRSMSIIIVPIHFLIDFRIFHIDEKWTPEQLSPQYSVVVILGIMARYLCCPKVGVNVLTTKNFAQHFGRMSVWLKDTPLIWEKAHFSMKFLKSIFRKQVIFDDLSMIVSETWGLKLIFRLTQKYESSSWRHHWTNYQSCPKIVCPPLLYTIRSFLQKS